MQKCLFILLPQPLPPRIKDKPKLENSLFQAPPTPHLFLILKSTLVRYHLATMKCITWKCTIQQILISPQISLVSLCCQFFLTHDPEIHWFAFCHYWCILSVQEFYLNWISQYLFCILLLSFSIMLLRFTHAVPWIVVHPFLLLIGIPLNKYSKICLSIHLLIFSVWLLQIKLLWTLFCMTLLWTNVSISFEWKPSCTITELYNKYIFSFIKIAKYFPKWFYHLILPQIIYGSSFALHSCQNVVLSASLTF